MRRELLIVCGTRRDKSLSIENHRTWEGLVTLDHNPTHKPDVQWDLLNLPLPFDADSLDEIHAYEVLEHTGQQGDYKFFFAQFSDFWRMLKPGGAFLATVPARDSIWAWGDPSHTRIITSENLIFLVQPKYGQIGLTAMSDFRDIYKADFNIGFLEIAEGSVRFALQAVKPSRIGDSHGIREQS